MCGIIGILGKAPNRKDKILKGLELLQHRGPDGNGIWEDENIILGHTRLSILDLSPSGAQPMVSQNQNGVITFNGEIYNYLELKLELQKRGKTFKSECDTEVLLEMLTANKYETLPKLNGMFAFAFWDTHSKTLLLGRDRFGEKPLYYFQDHLAFYFASELTALRSILPQQVSINHQAVTQYLMFQYIPGDLNLYNRVKSLPAGHFLKLDLNFNKDIRPYWNPRENSNFERDPNQLVKGFEKSIAQSLQSDVPVGVALSGGIDSGAIAIMSRHLNKTPVTAFSVGYPGFPNFDERPAAQALAKKLSIPFIDTEITLDQLLEDYPKMISALDTPVADIAAYPIYRVMKLAKESGTKVMLSGIGGDELFWGYPWSNHALEVNTLKLKSHRFYGILKILLPVIKALVKLPYYRHFGNHPKIPLFFRNLVKMLAYFGDYAYRPKESQLLFETHDEFGSYSKNLSNIINPEFHPNRDDYWQHSKLPLNLEDLPLNLCQDLWKLWMEPDCLTLNDRLSMCHSIECRAPFLNSEVSDIAISFINNFDSQNDLNKGMLKNAFKVFMDSEILQRPKRGFQPPVSQWRTEMAKRYLPDPFGSKIIKSGIFNKTFIRDSYKQFVDGKGFIPMYYRLANIEAHFMIHGVSF